MSFFLAGAIERPRGNVPIPTADTQKFNSNTQIPNPKQIPINKEQCKKWRFVCFFFAYCILFGIWILEFGISRSGTLRDWHFPPEMVYFDLSWKT